MLQPIQTPALAKVRATKVRVVQPSKRSAARADVPGHTKLRQWKRACGFTVKELAGLFRNSWESVHAWLYRSRRPGPKMRAAIEAATDGEVKVADWLNTAELALLAERRRRLEVLAARVLRVVRSPAKRRADGLSKQDADKLRGAAKRGHREEVRARADAAR